MQMLAIGEVMVELAPAGHQNQTPLMKLGFAGDSFNTAIYLSRLGIQVGYFTQLGQDPYSHSVKQLMLQEGLTTEWCACVPNRTLGLYAIANQANGERSFTFWRGQSPARELFQSSASCDTFNQALAQTHCVYFTGITLGILSESARLYLINALTHFRQRGGQVIFDNNYRPALWSSPEEAQTAMNMAFNCASTALITDDDFLRLYGDASLKAILNHCDNTPLDTLIVKRGPASVLAATRNAQGFWQVEPDVPVSPVQNLVDTTAAGDSFNAGYLMARFKGFNLGEAIQAGNRCAGQVIQVAGAIVPKAQFDVGKIMAHP